MVDVVLLVMDIRDRLATTEIYSSRERRDLLNVFTGIKAVWAL